MSHVTIARPDLFSQTQAGAILGVDRRTVRDLAIQFRLVYKSDNTRAGKMLDRSDMERLATSLGKAIDWEALPF